MKRLFAATLLGVCCHLIDAAELKLATIDVQRVLDDYYKAQDAARELKTQEVSFAKELEGLRLEGRRLASEAEALRHLSLDNVLSSREREEKRKGLELKLTDLQSFEVRYQQAREQRETELRAQAARVNRSIFDDVLSATRRIGDREGFNLILNASQANPLTSDVVFARNIEDITARVLASLNAARPAASKGSSSPESTRK